MGFQPAQRKQAKLKIALMGPSGSGKTYSALLIAKGMGGKIAVIDSERGSASLYAGQTELPPFDVQELIQYDPEVYIRAIKEAVAGGYDIIIIDSLSHEWGTVKKIAEDNKKGNNDWSGWATATPRHQALIDTIIQAPIHVICTMRSKTEWSVEKDEKTGKSKPVKIGIGPDQRQNLEYEFSTVFYIAQDNKATADKDRTGLFTNLNDKLSEETGKKLQAWLTLGVENPDAILAPEERKKFVFTLLAQLGRKYEEPNVKEGFQTLTGKESMTLWTSADVEKVIKFCEEKYKEQNKQIKTGT